MRTACAIRLVRQVIMTREHRLRECIPIRLYYYRSSVMWVRTVIDKLSGKVYTVSTYIVRALTQTVRTSIKTFDA